MRPTFTNLRITGSLAALLFASSTAFSGSETAKEKWSTNPFDHPVFVENKGQFDKKDGLENSAIKFGARRGEMQVYFTPGSISYRMDEFSKDGEEEREAALEKVHNGGKPRADKIKPHFVHIEWLGANSSAELIAQDKVDYSFTYPDVTDATYTRSFKASAYKKIIYKNLYPNIDVEYFFPEDKEGIKYSIILHPGADASVIKMKYSGEASPRLDAEGNVKFGSSFFGEFTDHAPVTISEYADVLIPSSFVISGNTVKFNLGEYNHSQKVIIDPWSTNPNFAGYNAAYDLEYDLNMNAYVFGGNYPFQEIKLSPAGAILWVYTASLFYSSGCTGPCYGDFAVDGTSGSSYLVEGFNGGSGTRVIKVNTAGAQVAVFPGNINLGEMWRIVYNNCSHKSVIAGGGTSMTYQACVLDTNCTTMTPVNVLGATTALHDMNLLALDNTNMAYMATARSLSYPTAFNNSMLKVPGATLSPQSWMVSDGYNFAEVSTVPYVINATSCANGFNGMAVSPNFLYTYDGSVLKKWNKTNGTLVGSVTVGPTPYVSGGIDVDDCDNIYVGNQSTVKKYDVSLTNTASYTFANTIYDVRLGPNNTLYAAGKQFAAAQTLPNNVCNPLVLSITGAGNCSSGSATVTVTGGTGPYSYSWSTIPPQTTQTATGLTPGTYTVTVRDQSCIPKIKTDTITITNFSNLAATTAATNPQCSTGTGSATATVTGGTAPYTYSWNTTPPQTTQTATGLAVGSYTVTVTDNAGCTRTAIVTITAPAAITITTSSTQPVCAASNGSATAAASGGTGPFTYSWSNGATTSSISNLAAGNYTVVVTDANGCTSSVSLTLTATGNQPVLTIQSSTNVLCNGGNNGSATANATGGNPPLTYSWSNGQTTTTATGLTANTYTVYVTTSTGCTATQTVTITQPPVLAATTTKTDVSCNGGNNGSATCSVTGGTGPYSYSWSNSQTTQSASNLTAGNYTVTVTDANGCTTQVNVTITQPTVLTSSIAPPANICPGACATLTVSANGGTSPYTFSWSNGASSSSVQACPTVTSTYTATVTDNKGCTRNSTVTLTVFPPVTVAFTGDTLSGCVPLCVNFTNNTSNSSVCQWNFGDNTTSSVCNANHCYVTPGTYTVSLTVTNTNGCSNILTMNNYVNVYPRPTANFNMTPRVTTIYNPNICFTDGSIGATQWTWSFGDPANSTSNSQNPCFSYRDTGTYCVRLSVANANNCRDTITYCLVIQPEAAIFVPNAFTPNGDGFNDTFFPKGTEIDPNNFQMWIFDRWGNMIFETRVWGQGWDGRANGGKEIAQEDVYVWKINWQDKKGGIHKLVGHVSLIK